MVVWCVCSIDALCMHGMSTNSIGFMCFSDWEIEREREVQVCYSMHKNSDSQHLWYAVVAIIVLVYVARVFYFLVEVDVCACMRVCVFELKYSELPHCDCRIIYTFVLSVHWHIVWKSEAKPKRPRNELGNWFTYVWILKVKFNERNKAK